MPTIGSEIKLIETISQAKVMGIALSHEGLAEEEVLETIEDYEEQFELPTTDVLKYGCQKFIEILGEHFPKLNQKSKQENIYKMPMMEMVNIHRPERINTGVYAKKENFSLPNKG